MDKTKNKDVIESFNSTISFRLIIFISTALFFASTIFVFFEKRTDGWFDFINTSHFLFIFICYLWLVSIVLFIRKNSLKRFFHPEKYIEFLSQISVHITFLVLALSFTLSAFILPLGDDPTQYRISDFIGNSSFINMLVSMYFGAFGLLTTIVVLRQQRYEIIGFERFLDETRELFRAEVVAANKLKTEKKLRNSESYSTIYIVDFQPFIGSKSVKQGTSAYDLYESYLDSLNDLAKQDNIKLNIICHTDEKIKSAFGEQNSIPLENNDNKLSVKKAIEKLSGHDNVSIWRSNDIGPYHFIITPDTAIEYIVIPESQINNKNKLIASKTNDYSKIDYLKKTAEDIISNAIKPISPSLQPMLQDFNSIIELTYNNTTILSTHYVQAFKFINKIQLRFQFERADGEILNPTKGYFPLGEDKYYDFDNSSFGLKLLKEGEVSYVLATPSDDKLFQFDDNFIWFDKNKKEKRVIARKEVKSCDISIDRVYLRIKFQYSKADDLSHPIYTTHFSHKTLIKLW